VLLAAGSGRRYGMPKALVDSGSGPWVLRALDVMHGLAPLIVVVGAAADQVAALLPAAATAVGNPDHAQGMGTSLRAGLAALDVGDVDAAVIMLVDLPGVGPAVVERVCHAAGSSLTARSALVRAAFEGIPGHPVLIGRDHWHGVKRVAVADRGARDYFAAHPPVLVECGDIGSGLDVDLPADDRSGVGAAQRTGGATHGEVHGEPGRS
jgi:CTP:molybdopterin cytidylyltransferase MocA